MSAILEQIQEDSGECGARARKNAQRNLDASPDKTKAATSEAEDKVEGPYSFLDKWFR